MLVDRGELPEPAPLQVPPETYALLLAFIIGLVAGVMLAAGWKWRRVLAALVLLVALLVGAVGGREWLVQLFLVPLCVLVAGATFAGFWQARRLFYGVLGLLLYVALLTPVSQYLGRSTFLYGLAWPAVALLVLGGR